MHRRFAVALLSLGTLVGVSVLGAHDVREPTQVWVVLGVPFPQPVPRSGSTFATELSISAWNGVPGAIELTIQHDPGFFDLVDVSFTEGSPFSDCSVDLTAASSGLTRLGCFRSTASDSSGQSLASFAIINWKIALPIRSETDIVLEVTSLVEERWQSVEVHAFGQHIDFFAATGIEETLLPSSLRLGHNYPNPFITSTTLPYDLPQHTRVRIRVYNLLGQMVTTLVNRDQSPGHYEIQWDASASVSSGVYFYTLETPSFTKSRKMLLIK